jgi:CheY-like chemotaxis protein
MKRPVVLIVDDDESTRDLCAEFLESEGYRSVRARDGQEALERGVACVPDVVLLDVVLPGLDGVETCRQLKADPRTRHIPVALMSARSRLNDYQARAGADGVLSKPFDLDTLLHLIQTLLVEPAVAPAAHAAPLVGVGMREGVGRR